MLCSLLGVHLWGYRTVATRPLPQCLKTLSSGQIWAKPSLGAGRTTLW